MQLAVVQDNEIRKFKMTTCKSSARDRRQKMREREVLDQLRGSRLISTFWLQEPCTRWTALKRMEARGRVSIEVKGFPMYRVRIHRLIEIRS